MARAALLLACFGALVAAVIPSGELLVGSTKIFAAPALFGEALPDEATPLALTVLRPLKLQDGCDPNVTVPTSVGASGFAILVQRSPNCTFGARALAAQRLGAAV